MSPTDIRKANFLFELSINLLRVLLIYLIVQNMY